jgi:hypothetical protein
LILRDDESWVRRGSMMRTSRTDRRPRTGERQSLHLRVFGALGAAVLAIAGCADSNEAATTSDSAESRPSTTVGPSSVTTTASSDATAATVADTTTAGDGVGDVAAITDAFIVFFDGASTTDEKVAVLENGEQLRPMLEDAAEDPSFASLSAQVHSVDLLPDTECAAEGHTAPCARVEHDLFVGTYPAAANQTSYAVVQDGTWRVAMSSWCAFVAIGGATCPEV